ncbi:hybrid sensor histidine kinase/response regulator transcription factor [Neolewinella persica]|uniref:hybrid sensor histidine kinase/response regulator transcription factor n=1 Tax=Neolewinella persica TaxID=70998 RepID=UPI00036B3A97|nr:two-component regulator propeller domain-containing protein [Neolewinella persica]
MKERYREYAGSCFLPVLLLIAIALPAFVTAQEDNLYVERIGSQEGLSANYVTSIFQDDDGYIWFGTFGGLNRYDGYEIKEFTPNPQVPGSISGIRVFTITDDKEGNLWVGTTGKGLNFYDRSTNKFRVIQHDPEDQSSLLSNTISHLASDQRNRMWVATNEGLSVLDLSEFKENEKPAFQHFQLDDEIERQFIQTVFIDDSGNIWASSRRYLYRALDSDKPVFKRISNLGFTDTPIESIVQAASGELLVAGGAGLFQQNAPGSEEFTKVGYLTSISTMAYDKRTDQLWVGAASGLHKFAIGRNGETPVKMSHYHYNPQDPKSLSGDDVTALFIDESRVVWAGTSGGGVSKFDPLRKKFYHHKNSSGTYSLSGNTIRAVYQDAAEQVWVGSDGGGLNKSTTKLVPNEESTFRHYSVPNRVYAILEVNNEIEHAMYFGSASGPGMFRKNLKVANSDIEPLREMAGSVFSLLEDRRGSIWVGTYSEGLFRWDPDKNEPGGYRKTSIGFAEDQEGALPNHIIRSLKEDKSGNIWIGTGGGLVLLRAEDALSDHPQLTVFRSIPGDSTSLSNDYILPIYVAKDGNIWVGTFGGGLNRFLPPTEGEKARFKSYGEKEGLINGVIKDILEDESGHLWISSNNGISRFNPEDDTFENFDVNDGLQGDEFGELAAFQQQDGTMIFGGVNGLSVFSPQAIKPNPILAKPMITGMSILNKPIEVGESRDGRIVLPQQFGTLDKIELDYHQNSLSFDLAALHFATPKKNSFAYKLDGWDDDWIYTTADQRSATYTNLPHRSYTFMLKVSNSDQVWNEEILKLGVVIHPPFWKTTIAYIFYGLLFLGFLYLIRRYSIIDIKEKNLIQLKKVDQEKTEELNQLKLQFFTNISHEFRTPLTLIAGPLENLIRNQSSIAPDQRNQYYHLMYKNSKYLLRLVNELLDFRRLDQGQLSLRVSKNDVVNYIEETVAPFEFLATKKQIDFEVKAEERPITTWFAPEALEKILFNLLSNAFKFTPEGGAIEVAISKTTADDRRFKTHLPGYGALLITVKDTGIGIPSKQLKRVFDRFYKSTQAETANREGAGIGLAYTKSLVDRHHGLIDVVSKPGEGTTFYLRFALDKSVYHRSEIEQRDLDNYTPQADPVDYFMPDEQISDDELNELQLHTNRLVEKEDAENTPILLYIDDNPDLRNYIRQSFSNDFRVIAADGGESGLELARTSSPDIIITDVMMPGIDGMEVLETLKNDPLTSHIPVIMLTAKDTEEGRLEGLKYGADGYVTKPFNYEALQLQIINIVQHRDILRNRFRREVITEPAEVTVTDSDEIFLRQAMDIVEDNMSNTEFSVDQLVKEMGVSRSKLYLKLKALTGQSSSEFVRTVRLKRAVQLLENSNYSVKEVMYMTGFNTASYFSKCFKRQFGIVPSEYVRQEKRARMEE